MARPNLSAGMICLILCSFGCGGGSTSVTAPRAPTITIAVSPALVAPGQESSLTWSSTDADSYNASGAWGGPQQTSGSQKVTQAAAGDYTYAAARHSLPVTIQNAAKPSFTATSVSYGKRECDLSANGTWAGPTSNDIGAVGVTFNVSLPAWSVAGGEAAMTVELRGWLLFGPALSYSR
jgi:hypothetical protein